MKHRQGNEKEMKQNKLMEHDERRKGAMMMRRKGHDGRVRGEYRVERRWVGEGECRNDGKVEG